MHRQNVLDVGCGSGTFIEWLLDRGHGVTGIEPSPAMLDLAGKRLPGSVQLDRGVAEELPYEDNAFDTVALIGTLEFVDDPERALDEACRVAKQHVLIGALNRYSLRTLGIRTGALWNRSVYRYARFQSVFELERLVRKTLNGKVPVEWRTCLALPLSLGRAAHLLDRIDWVRRQPFGHFIAMRVDLVYPVRTVQDPVFAEINPRIGRVSPHSTCYSSHGRGGLLEKSLRGDLSGDRYESSTGGVTPVTGVLEEPPRV